MKRVRVLHDGQATWAQPVGDTVVLDDGTPLVAGDVRYLPPVQPTKILATHLSYMSRCVDFKMAHPPAVPSYFLKPLSSLSYHGASVARPKGCRFLNYEGEIAVIIGKRCSNVAMDDALEYVSGYTVANDWGVHDFRHADRGSMLRVKGQDGFCPLGPIVVDAGEVDPTNLTVRTYVNGEMVQEGSTGDDLLFSFAYQIADLSRVITLEPGDVLLTGTPAHSRPVDIGDVVEVEVDGIGRLRNTVIELARDLVPVGVQPEITGNTLHVALAMAEDEAEREAVVIRGGAQR